MSDSSPQSHHHRHQISRGLLFGTNLGASQLRAELGSFHVSRRGKVVMAWKWEGMWPESPCGHTQDPDPHRDGLSLPGPSSILQVKARPLHPPEGTAWQGRGPGPRTQPIGRAGNRGAKQGWGQGTPVLPESSPQPGAPAFLPRRGHGLGMCWGFMKPEEEWPRGGWGFPLWSVCQARVQAGRQPGWKPAAAAP